MRKASLWWAQNIKGKHLWWELFALVLVLFLAWGLIKLTPIPAIFWPGPPTPAPVPTPTPPANTFYFTLPVADLSQPESLTGGMPADDARLIVFVKETATAANGATSVRYTSHAFCVKSVAFLDANNEHMQQFDKEKTKAVLFAVRGEDLGPYGEAMLGKTQVYLVADPACEATFGS